MRPGCSPWMGVGGRAGVLLPPAGVGCLGCGRAEPAPTFPGASWVLLHPPAPWHVRHPGSSCGLGAALGAGWVVMDLQGGLSRILGWEVESWAILLEWCKWCQPCSQNWMGQDRAEEEPGTFSFHTWETVKSQVATPAFVWYFQKNPAGPGIPGHNLLWKNKIIKYQSL